MSNAVAMNDLRSRIVIIFSFEGDLGNFVWHVNRLGLLRSGWAWVSVWAVNVMSAHEHAVQLAVTAGEDPKTLPLSAFEGLVCLEFDLLPDTAAFRQFQNDVRAKMPKFGITAVSDDEPVDVYAGPLYDAVLLYAHSIREVLTQGLSPRNTTAVLAAALEVSFEGVTGFVKLDPATGNRLSNTWVRFHLLVVCNICNLASCYTFCVI